MLHLICSDIVQKRGVAEFLIYLAVIYQILDVVLLKIQYFVSEFTLLNKSLYLFQLPPEWRMRLYANIFPCGAGNIMGGIG
ncbi:MAG: hypothetical protein RR860_16035 [Janthinobacterium sp.]